MTAKADDLCIHQMLASPHYGGANRTVLYLACHARDRGVRGLVWTPGPGAAQREAEKLGLPVVSYNLSGAHSRSRWKALWANLALAWRLRRGGPGLVHMHFPPNYGALRLAARLSGLKSVVHLQSEESAEGLRWSFRRPPELIITCNSVLVQDVRQALPEGQRDRVRVAPVPNSVDLEQFTPPADKRAAKEKVKAPPRPPLILMLANLSPIKGQETAVRALALLKRRGVEALLWLAGTERGGAGSYTKKLQDLVAECGVGDRVTFLGHRTDAADLLRAADLFLLPSTTEGLPLAILEAQATRVPVIASPVGGVAEAVREGVTGYLVPPGDAAGYADRAAALLGDPGLYARVAGAGYDAAVNEFSRESLCRKVWALYEELLGRRLG